MKRILITSGATREYLDPVRYITNGSSGKMGAALAEAVLHQGNMPVIVSGQATVSYPQGAEVHRVITTEDMLKCCLELFPSCAGVIGAAAPCDFRPVAFSAQKISKTKDGSGLTLQFTETPDILAALGKIKRPDQWSVAFALETQDGIARANEKLKQKNCNFVVLNFPDSIDNDLGTFLIYDVDGSLCQYYSGRKIGFSFKLLKTIRLGLKKHNSQKQGE